MPLYHSLIYLTPISLNQKWVKSATYPMLGLLWHWVSLYMYTFNFLSINLSSSNFLLSKRYGHCVQPTSSTSLKLTVFHIQLLLQLSLSYYFFKSPLPHHHFTYNSHALALNSRVLLTKLKWEINQAYVSSEVQKSRLCTIKTNTFINTLCVHTCKRN